MYMREPDLRFSADSLRRPFPVTYARFILGCAEPLREHIHRPHMQT